jgi:hypothetical protein
LSTKSVVSKTFLAILLVVGLAAAIGGVVLLNRDHSVDTPDAAPSTLGPLPAPAPDGANTGLRHQFRQYPKAAVLADTLAMGYVGAGRGWPDLLAGQMCWSMSGKSVELETGYTNPGGKPDTSAFTERADDVAKEGPAIVIVEGGLHDYRATPEKLQEAAASVFTTLKEQLPPESMVVAVGPIVGDVASPEDVARVSGPIAAAAAEKGVIWIDPMAERWLPDMNYFSRDGLLPNDKGQIEYANRLAAALRNLGAPAGC